jgi:hypothetical protein
LPAEALFCDKCGHKLKSSEKDPIIDFDRPQSYTPKHLADKILTTRSTLEGERKLVTGEKILGLEINRPYLLRKN